MRLNIFRDALKLDPLDCFPNAAYPPMWDNVELMLRRSPARDTKWFPRTVRFIAFLKTAATGLFQVSALSVCQKPKHYFFGLTHNQRASLSPVVDEMNAYRIDSAALFSSTDIQPIIKKSSLWALPYLVPLLIRMVKEKGYRKRSFRWAFDDYWRAYGLYVAFRLWLGKHQPETVVVSNDHSLVPCVLNKAAQDEGIPTFYIQHACVTEKFPPLKVDFALLEGADAMEKYAAVSDGSTKIQLIGIPKFDAFSKLTNHSDRCHSIGICFSLADNLDRCVELLEGLAGFKDLQTIVRPHMGMSDKAKNKFVELCQRYGFDYSKHQDEHSFDFLQRIDVLVSGTSAIALEAVLLNVTSLNYVLNPESPDWYGFIKNGLTRSTDSIEEIRAWISELLVHRPNVIAQAKKYCASIDTDYHGRSSMVAGDIIRNGGIVD